MGLGKGRERKKEIDREKVRGVGESGPWEWERKGQRLMYKT